MQLGVNHVFFVSHHHSSGFSGLGLNQSQSYCKSLFGATVSTQSTSHIGLNGIKYHVGFNIPPLLNLGFIDTLNQIPMPQIDFHHLRDLPHLNIGEVGSVVR